MDTLPINKIYPNPNQPRRFFHQGKLEELAQTITENGLIEPLIVVPRDRHSGVGRYPVTGTHMIIAGERRWRACGIAGLKDIPVIIKDANDQQVAELALLENLQREDLNVVEEALAYQDLINRGLSREQIAQKMGMKQSWRIQERLNLLKLTVVFQDYVVKGILTPSQAQEMSRLPRDKQDIIFDKIQSGKLDTYNKLRSMVNSLIQVEDQTSFIMEPSPEDKKVVTRYDAMIEKMATFLRNSFNREDLTVLAKVLTPCAKVNIERIDDMIMHLNKIKRALMQSDSTSQAVQLKIAV
jgi:ParB/RepB/Spo0J family partition protein